MTHGRHIYAKSSDMSKGKMCTYPYSDHVFPHWKCVMIYCAKFARVNLPDQETYNQYSYTSPSILFHIYRLIACCTTHGRLLLNEKHLLQVLIGLCFRKIHKNIH